MTCPVTGYNTDLHAPAQLLGAFFLSKIKK